MVKEACFTIGVLAQCLADAFDPLVGFVFPALLRLTGVKTLVMSQSAHDALVKVVEHTSPSAAAEAVLAHATTTKGPKERTRCMEYLSLLLDQASVNSLERHKDSIAAAVIAGESLYC